MNFISKLSTGFISTTILIFHAQLATAQTVSNGSEIENKVEKLARNITVEVVSLAVNGNEQFVPSGSGVIIKREGNKYYVVTNEHVVTVGEAYVVIVYSGSGDLSDIEPPQKEVKSIEKYPEPEDLALLTFTSQQTYEEAVLGDPSSLREGTPVFVAGFPSAVEKRGDWKFTPLKLANEEPVSLGRSLTYQPIRPDNKPEKGMSGGPVLNEEGQLVGIHQGETNDRTAGQGIPLKAILARFPGLQKESESAIIVNKPPVNEPDMSLKVPVVRDRQ